MQTAFVAFYFKKYFMKKDISYYVNPGFWDLVLKLTPYISKSGEAAGNRISFDEFKILLWRFHGNIGLRECVRLIGKKITHQRIQQKEARALKVIKQLLIDRYGIN